MIIRDFILSYCLRITSIFLVTQKIIKKLQKSNMKKKLQRLKETKCQTHNEKPVMKNEKNTNKKIIMP